MGKNQETIPVKITLSRIEYDQMDKEIEPYREDIIIDGVITKKVLTVGAQDRYMASKGVIALVNKGYPVIKNLTEFELLERKLRLYLFYKMNELKNKQVFKEPELKPDDIPF